MAASHVRKFRQDRQLSLGAVAVLSGLNINYISRLERGERQPGPAQLVALARGLGTSVQRLSHLLAEPEPEPGLAPESAEAAS